MEAVRLKLPDSLEADDFLQTPATWEQYLAVVADTAYTLQYLEGDIIGSQPDAEHEVLIPALGWLLGNYFHDKDDYCVLGSNIKIAVEEGHCDVNADLSVVRLPVDYGVTPVGRPPNSQITNPEIVVEVLSKSTRKFDLSDKLVYYKRIPSLQHILFVEQSIPAVSVYSRTDTPDEWLNRDYQSLESVVQMGVIELPMKAIYSKTISGS